MKISIPEKLQKVLQSDQLEYGKIGMLIDKYEPFLEFNRMDFFSEYTGHGILHINDILSAIEELITENSWQLITSKDISVLIQATLLHDLGMHINIDIFRKLVLSEDIVVPEIDKISWKYMWRDFLKSCGKLSEYELTTYFGTSNKIKPPNFDNLSEVDR